jgi:hypothetical protein
MNELLEKVDIEDGFYIYLQRNSKVWLARFKIDGKWISRTTKQRDKTKAIIAANKVKTECDVLHAHGVSIQTKAFNVVAELAIKRMQEALPGAKGQRGKDRSRTTNASFTSTTSPTSTAHTSITSIVKS